MKERVTLKLPPNLKFLRLASAAGADAAWGVASTVGLENQDAFVHSVELAVSEVFANAVKHRCPVAHPWRIIVEFGIGDRGLEVSVKDRNPRFDLSNVPPPDVDAYPESGYGLYLVKQVMDTVTVRREPDGNVIIMAKAIRPEKT